MARFTCQTCESAEECGDSADNWKCEGGVCKPDFCSSDDDCEDDETCRVGSCERTSDGAGFEATCRDILCQNGNECEDEGTEPPRCVCSEGDCIDGFECVGLRGRT